MYTLSRILLFLAYLSFAVSQNVTFQKDFKFGAATAAFQIEGGWNLDGKSANIWDYWIHKNPSVIKDGTNGDIAADSYHKYMEDIKLLRDIGAEFYRFSIAWTRILPSGYSNKINQAGVDYYNKIIDELVKYNIKPVVTIYHWDLPQALQDRGGFQNELLAEWFRDYAEVLFDKFGDRVNRWITFNEPYQICEAGYGIAYNAPGFAYTGIADYQCARVLLLAHTEAYHLYKNKYKDSQKGVIGLTLQSSWAEPKTDTQEDKDAAERFLEFLIGCYLNPLISKSGDWPKVMRDRIAANSKEEGYKSSRLPPFSNSEIRRMKGALDFVGLNHYTTYWVSNYNVTNGPPGIASDSGLTTSHNPKYKTSILTWLQIVPYGIRKSLNWVTNKYSRPVIHITENGYPTLGEIDDQDRIDYIQDYLREIWKATYEDKNKVGSYTVWSLIDNMEWIDGYVPKFGLYKVDFNSTEKERTPRKSANWFKHVIKTRKV